MIKLVNKAVRTRCHGLETAVDGVFKEYSHLIQALRELQQDPKSGSTAKGYSKTWAAGSFHVKSSDNPRKFDIHS